MNKTTISIRSRSAHRRYRLAGPVIIIVAMLIAATTGATASLAYWTATGSSAAVAATERLAPPTAVTAPTSATADVAVGWTPGTGGVEPTGYVVSRHTEGSVAAACGSSPTELVTGTTCTDMAVPDGTHTYVVTAVYASWTASSAPSDAVVVVNASGFLGAAGSYSVLAGTAVVNTGATTVSGDVGISPGTSITGFPAGAVGGDIHAGDASAAAAQTALDAAYDDLSTRPPDAEQTVDLGGLILTPGVYHSSAALALTGTVTLDGQGDPDAIFVFQTDAAFNTAAASVANLINGAQASNVFWVVAGAAGTGANSYLSGTILARGAITLGAETELIGRALSRDAVTLAATTIRFTDALPPAITIDGGPTSFTADTTPTVTGTSDAPASSRVTATIAGQTLLTTVGVGGTWTVTAAALAAGPHEVIVKVRDAAGNSTAASQTLTVEVNPPTVDLGTAASYSVLAGPAVVNTGATNLSGDLGVSPGTLVVGFPPGTFAGDVHAGDDLAADAQTDLLAALDDASSRTRHTEIIGDLGGRTFHVGVHHSTAALALTGTVTLDGQGDPEATFIFQTDAAFDTAAASSVNLVNGAQASNVFWVVAGAAGTGANSYLSGTILARGAITLGASTELTGRALSRDAVTLASNAIADPTPTPAFRQVPSVDPDTGGGTDEVDASPLPPAPSTTNSVPPLEQDETDDLTGSPEEDPQIVPPATGAQSDGMVAP